MVRVVALGVDLDDHSRRAMRGSIENDSTCAGRPAAAPPTTTRRAAARRSADARGGSWGDRLYAAWLLFATTGMRRGEVAGLTWDDIDLDAGRVTVHGQLEEPLAAGSAWHDTQTDHYGTTRAGLVFVWPPRSQRRSPPPSSASDEIGVRAGGLEPPRAVKPTGT
jgi:integrase